VLFDAPRQFSGIPRESFALFDSKDRELRRRRILDEIHPALAQLGEDLLATLGTRAGAPLHAHLPRLDWPRGYEPFCTWLALSHAAHGYQAGPQLNLGVHVDHVAIRLGWDTQAPAFGRFEFLCRHGGLGRDLVERAADHAFRFRVYASAPWPRGSERVFESVDDLLGSFDATHRRGVWWELGHRFELPAEIELVASAALGAEAARLFTALLPCYERISGVAATGA
jgi:hypothetical protein